jgi:hypothetical protein
MIHRTRTYALLQLCFCLASLYGTQHKGVIKYIILVGLVPLPPEDEMLVVVPAPLATANCWNICCTNRSGGTQSTYDVQSLSIVVLMELVSAVIKAVFAKAL